MADNKRSVFTQPHVFSELLDIALGVSSQIMGTFQTAIDEVILYLGMIMDIDQFCSGNFFPLGPA